MDLSAYGTKIVVVGYWTIEIAWTYRLVAIERKAPYTGDFGRKSIADLCPAYGHMTHTRTTIPFFDLAESAAIKSMVGSTKIFRLPRRYLRCRRALGRN